MGSLLSRLGVDSDPDFPESGEGCWANKTPWYMTELISKETTSELSPESPERIGKETVIDTLTTLQLSEEFCSNVTQ